MDKNTFFQSARPKVTSVEFGENAFFVKHLSITETLAFESKIKKLSSEDNIVSVLVACVCDEQGNALLTIDDKEQLKQIDSNVAVGLYRAAMSLNKMSEDEIDDLKKTDEQPAPTVYLSDGEA